MKKLLGVCFVAVTLVYTVSAQTIYMRTDSGFTTTGKLLDETRDVAQTTNVLEIADLMITARTDNPDHKLNANSESLGINNMVTNIDEAARFEADEKMIVSFSQSITITNLDFRFFDAGETFTVTVSNQTPVVIAYDDLDSKINDDVAVNILVPANIDVEFFTTGNGEIGLEAMGLMVELLPCCKPVLLIVSSNGVPAIVADFNGTATGSYALQSCTNLCSNDWTTLTGSISTDTNIVINAQKECEYFRITVE